MKPVLMALALAFAAVTGACPATAQSLEIKRYNPSEWTKGRFTEMVTVNGPGKVIYLAGVGSEEEKTPAGERAAIRHLGDPYQQCLYAYDKIKRLLASQGATLADVVKQVVYVNDIRYQAPVGKCRREMYGSGPIPANTFLVISGFAIQGMLLEIDVTAVVGNK
ncbi:MAG: RidA family protein [Hyphomicrobiaceae bacterium]